MQIRQDLADFRKKHILWAIEQTRGNLRESARLINIPSATFNRWVRELSLADHAAKLRHKRVWGW